MKCILYNIWFGEIPIYFPYHQMSCDLNHKNFHWVVYTDQVSKITKWSKAITAYPYSWEELIYDFSKINVKLTKPTIITRPVTKTLAQCRLFLPMLRKEQVGNYTHWGITEFDVVYGNLIDYCKDAEDYLMISGDPRAGCGPFSILRKDCQKMLLNYPNLIDELEKNSYDSIETNQFLQFFEQQGKVKRHTGLQPIRELRNHGGGHARWLNGNLFVGNEQLKAGFFHFGGQRKLKTFKVDKSFGEYWNISNNGIQRIKVIKLL